MNSPETRPSLLLRVRNREDREAWAEFSEIYRPVIQRLARLKGMQDADSEDLAQQVLLTVASAIERFEPDDSRARFRTWIKTIARNAILNALTRGAPDQATGAADMQAFLEQRPDPGSTESAQFQHEYRREVFLWASRQIRPEFSEETWQSFWLTAVEGLDVDAAAEQLERTRGSVYASRSRVMRRLKQKVEEFTDGDDDL
ncbi:MAG: sigma-70 family RNA polymerase sigma factor [Fuerstiella sp.]